MPSRSESWTFSSLIIPCRTGTFANPAPCHPKLRAKSRLAAQFWRLARRIGKKKAALAVAHSILTITWHLLHDNTTYADLGSDWFVRRIDNNTRRRDRLIGELQGMGYQVSLEKAAS